MAEWDRIINDPEQGDLLRKQCTMRLKKICVDMLSEGFDDTIEFRRRQRARLEKARNKE